MSMFDFKCDPSSFSVRLSKIDAISQLDGDIFYVVINGHDMQVEGWQCSDILKFEAEYKRFVKEWKDWVSRNP